MLPHIPLYHQEDGEYLVEIMPGGLKALFNPIDPAPLPRTELGEGVRTFLEDSAHDLPPSAPRRVRVYLPRRETEENPEIKNDIAEAIRSFFVYKHWQNRRELKDTLRNGRMTLLVGVVVLAFGLAGSEYFASLGRHQLWRTISEGLMVMAWVALWWPMQVLLYEWWPLKRMCRVYRRLENVPVEIKSEDEAPLALSQPLSQKTAESCPPAD